MEGVDISSFLFVGTKERSATKMSLKCSLTLSSDQGMVDELMKGGLSLC